MIEVVPAILESNIDHFLDLYNSYSDFLKIDIDISRTPFTPTNTVELSNLIQTLNFKKQSIGLHLMVVDPERDLITLVESGLEQENLRIYLHQEIDLTFLKDFDWPKSWAKCVVVNSLSKLKDLDFYNQFAEVQLMTVQIGFQGGEFNVNSLSKVDELRKMGFNKEISLDGGINLESAKIIRTKDINRVSVGSFLKSAINKKIAYNKLEELLNNK